MARIATALPRILVSTVLGLLVVPLLLGFVLPVAGATAAGTAPGNPHPVTLPGPQYPVRFAETGLPTGTNWTVTLGGNSSSSTGPLIVFYVANGTYNYSIGSTNGFVPSVPSGSLIVQGGNNSVVATLNVQGAKPWGGAWDPLTGNLLMAYDAKGNLSVINSTTNANTGNIPVGKSPDPPVYDPVHQYFYVPNWGTNNVTILNATTFVHVAEVPVGHAPIQGVFDPANGLVYVANSQGNSVSVLNGSNATPVATIGVGTAPEGIAYDPIDQMVYVTNSVSANVSVINGTPGSVHATVPLPANSGPWGITFDPVDRTLYVTQTGGAACSGGGGPCYGALINAVTHAYSGTFIEGASAVYPSFDSGNGFVYVANALNPGYVTVVASVTHAVVRTIPVGAGPNTVTVDPSNGCLYTADFAGNTLSVINGTIDTEAVTFVPMPPALYPVGFTESGLPKGTDWSVWVNGTEYGSGAASITLTEPNGTYSFAVVNVSGYHAVPRSGAFAVNGSGYSQSVEFTAVPPTLYPATFIESGLANGTSWGVVLNGAAFNSTRAWLNVSLENGSYSYAVDPVSGYTVSPATGNLTVNGGGVAVPISFVLVPLARYEVNVQEAGLPSGTSWSVTVGSVLLSGNGTSLDLNLTNGTYAYAVGVVAGFTASPANGQIEVNGYFLNLTVSFRSSAGGGGGGSGGAAGAFPAGGFFGVYGDALLVAVLLVALAALLLVVSRRRRRRSPSGDSMPSIAAEAGLPLSLYESAVPVPSPPAEPAPPPPDLPPAIRIREEPPPPKPEWAEE